MYNSDFLSVLIRLLWSQGTVSPTHVTSSKKRFIVRDVGKLGNEAASGVPVSDDSLLNIRCVLFFPDCLLLPDTARFICSFPLQFWLTHSWFCSQWGNSAPSHGILASALCGTTGLESICQSPVQEAIGTSYPFHR